MVTNAVKLSATLVKWMQPSLKDIVVSYVGNNPGARMLLPFVDYISTNTITTAINGFLSKMPDGMIPEVAHSIVNDAIKAGGFNIGNVYFSQEEMKDLKKLLNYNLPIKKAEEYEVITSNPNSSDDE